MGEGGGIYSHFCTIAFMIVCVCEGNTRATFSDRNAHFCIMKSIPKNLIQKGPQQPPIPSLPFAMCVVLKNQCVCMTML